MTGLKIRPPLFYFVLQKYNPSKAGVQKKIIFVEKLIYESRKSEIWKNVEKGGIPVGKLYNTANQNNSVINSYYVLESSGERSQRPWGGFTPMAGELEEGVLCTILQNRTI